jgi:hypothetical protein
VITEQDRTEWRAWRRERALEQQRWRRARQRRIDYYPSASAAALIDRLRTRAGASSILNRIVAEWVAHCSGIKSVNLARMRWGVIGPLGRTAGIEPEAVVDGRHASRLKLPHSRL